MKKLAATLLALVALAVTACGADDPPPLNKPDPPQSVSELPECRNVLATIEGRVATIYQARDPESEFFVLIVDDSPTCATDEEGVNESGVIPSEKPVDADQCPVCGGQPMPSHTFPGLL